MLRPKNHCKMTDSVKHLKFTGVEPVDSSELACGAYGTVFKVIYDGTACAAETTT